MRRACLWCLLLGCWGAAVAWGAAYSLHYELTPQAVREAPAVWPVASGCRLAADRPTLLMFIHPRCPCTRATLRELEQLVSHCPGRADVQLLAYRAGTAEPGWEQTGIWRSAAAIPGAKLRVDEHGLEQTLFGARVSGETLLYDASGRLLFHGGITASRGHSGDNAGRDALESLLLTGTSHSATTPVFGCTLESTWNSRAAGSSHSGTHR